MIINFHVLKIYHVVRCGPNTQYDTLLRNALILHFTFILQDTNLRHREFTSPRSPSKYDLGYQTVI